MASASDLLNQLFSVGVPAYVDLQKAQAYKANDPTPNTSDAYGNGSPAGQAGRGSVAAVLSNVPSWVWLAGVGAVVLVVVLARRK